MRKRSTVFLCVIMIFSLVQSISIVKAQASSWTAWLYDSDHGALMYIDNTMQAPNSFTLPLPASSKPSDNVILSPDANYIVYTGAATGETLYVYSRSQQKVVYQSPSQGRYWGLSVAGDSGIFDESGERIAVGYTENANSGHWGIDVINLKTGSVETSLTQSSPGTPNIRQYDIPNVRRFRNGEVTFTIILVPEDAALHATYYWNISSGKLSPSGAYPSNIDADTYDPTGETISAFPDARLPNCGCVCAALGMPSNALSVYDPKTKTHFPFFNAADATFSQPVFGQNGQVILVTAQNKATITKLPPSSLPGPGYDFKMGAKDNWIVARSGKLLGKLADDLPVLQLDSGFGHTYIGWQSGFLYLSKASDGGTRTSLVSVNTLTGLVNTHFVGSVVWEAPANMRLILIPTTTNMTYTGPFAAWSRLRPALSRAEFPPLSDSSWRHPGCP